MNSILSSLPRRSLRGTVGLGFVAGMLAGLLMLTAMAALRWFAGVPTVTELYLDRIFPLLSVDFFVGAMRHAGGYTSLKLDGVGGALVVQILGAGLGGGGYALFLRRHPGRGGWLVLCSVLGVTAVFVFLLWPNLPTSYRGLPPERATLLSSVGLLLCFAVGGLGLMGFYRLLAADESDRFNDEAEVVARSGSDMGRRAFLAGGIGAGLGLVLGALLDRLYRAGTFSYEGRPYRGPGVRKITPIRPQDEFYEGSKNLVDPEPERALWRLEIGGQVDVPRSYTFAEIAALPAVTQETTLLSMFYEVGGGQCSNALWTGVPLARLLEQVKPWGDDAVVLFQAADGYYETFRFDKALEPTTLLAYQMNGEPLPARHGFPLRLIVPGLYGEKSAKWLTRLEVVDRADPRLQRPRGLGFYREQGWGPDDVVPTHSRIDAPRVDGDHFAGAFTVGQTVELRGMAFGGDRGISRVEVSADDGKTWSEAEIYQRGTRMSWSLWRQRWVPAEGAGEVRIVVRATDGAGQPQIATDQPVAPQGATGWHRVRARVERASV